MKTAALAVTMMLVSVNAFATDCSGPYCPPNPYQPPPDFITNVCSAVQTQLDKTFTDAERASGNPSTIGQWEISWPQGWCALNEWHDGSFSIVLKNQSINGEIRRVRHYPGPPYAIKFTLDAVIDCFFDSTYQWRCGYEYSVLEFDQNSARSWATLVSNCYNTIYQIQACANNSWYNSLFYSSICMSAYSACLNDRLPRALSDLHETFVPKLESDLLPAVNQVANSMLH